MSSLAKIFNSVDHSPQRKKGKEPIFLRHIVPQESQIEIAVDEIALCCHRTQARMILLCGPPYTLKNDLASVFKKKLPIDILHVFGGHDYFSKENISFDASKMKTAHQKCQGNARRIFLESSRTDDIVIVNNTFCKTEHIGYFDEFKVPFILVMFEAENEQQVSSLASLNKDVPDYVFHMCQQNMRDVNPQSFHNLKAVYTLKL